MTGIATHRYPDPPTDFTPQQKAAWGVLIRILEKRDEDSAFGDAKTIPINQLKDGVFMKGFTPVTSVTSYYVKPDDGTLLVNSSAAPCTIFLTTARNSEYSMVCIKKVDGNGATNPVIIMDITSAPIDSGTAVTVSAQNGSIILSCDGQKWYILARYL